MPEESAEFLIDMDYIRQFVQACIQDKASGVNKDLIAEGERIAASFRNLFPEVSDKDMGTILVIFCEVFAKITETPVAKLTPTMRAIGGSYAYAASNIMHDVLAIEDMTS